jgi:hypothetical protein
VIEAPEPLETAIITNAHHVCVVCPDIDRGADRNATFEFELAPGNRPPCTVGRSSAQRFATNDGQSIATAIARKTFN